MRALLLALVAGLALVACGEGEDGDEARIGRAVERVATSADPAVCTELQTQRFTEQTVGEGATGRRAIRACERDAGRGAARRVEVADVEIAGERATANAALEGGVFDRQVLSLALVEDDEEWKLDALTGIAELDREALIAGYAEELARSGLPARVVACFREALEGQADDEIEDFVVNPTTANVERMFGPCEELLG